VSDIISAITRVDFRLGSPIMIGASTAVNLHSGSDIGDASHSLLLFCEVSLLLVSAVVARAKLPGQVEPFASASAELMSHLLLAVVHASFSTPALLA
jgi:hypothetical protein